MGRILAIRFLNARPSRLLCLLIALSCGIPPALADKDDAVPVEQVAIIAQRLDVARSSVQKSLGATSYTLTNDAVENRPSGETTTLDQVLLQMPGVSEDGLGNLHVRGSTSELEYRLNGVALPEGLTDLGDMLSTRVADNVELVTGALPAQFGLRTAGVVNITTKSGAYLNGGEAELYGGSYSEIEPALEFGRAFDNADLFATANYIQDNAGLAPPDRASPLHDHTQKLQGLAVGNYTLGADTRISLILGTSQNWFDIPNAHGANAATTASTGDFQRPLMVDGISSFSSEKLDRRQKMSMQFAVLSYLETFGKGTLQASAFAQRSQSAYRPDWLGELLFNGLSQRIDNSKTTAGIQADAEYPVGQSHTLRSGILATDAKDSFAVETWSLPIDGNGQQVSQLPLHVLTNAVGNDFEFSAYAEDEWKATSSLIVNYGVRFDRADLARAESTISPRINAVWEKDGTTVHIGYARLFTPPNLANEADPRSRPMGTTAMLPIITGSTPKAEIDDYFDIGSQHKFENLTLGLDAYLSQASDLLAQGQFGSVLIWTPYNFANGQRKGIEFSATYTKGPLSLWGNFAIARAVGRDIISNQFYFTPAQLSVVSSHSTPLDGGQVLTGLGGVSYSIAHMQLSADLAFGSGYRRSLGGLPNGSTLSPHTQANFTVVYHLGDANDDMFDLRLDMLNAFNNRYAILDGTALGGGLPQWSLSRAVYVGVEKSI